MRKPVTFTIPEQLNLALHKRIGRGKMSAFATRALWDALKKEEEALLLEFLGADRDAGNKEIKENFSSIEGEDFSGIEDFNFNEDDNQ